MLRLRRMPPAAVEVARAVALVGSDADLPAIATLSQLPEEQAAEALDLLSRSEILADSPPLRFVHPLAQDAVYHDVSAGDLALRHERAARILRERGARAENVAAHLLLSPARGDAAAVRVLRAARCWRPVAGPPTARSPTCAARWTSRRRVPTGSTCWSSSAALSPWSTGSRPSPT